MLTTEFISKYLVPENKRPTHKFYAQSVKLAAELEAHSKGHYPKDVIEVVRPNETDKQKDYRKSVFTPITQTYFSKVSTTVGKIGLAEDWSITWKEEPQGSLAKVYPLQEYTEKEYPYFDSFSNWFFTVQIKKMLEDSNGVIAVFPLDKENPEDDSELLRPFTNWFPSERVIDFVDEQYCVLLSEEKSIVLVNGEPVQDGLIFYFFDVDSWCKAVQVGEKDSFKFEYKLMSHWVGYMPCFKIGGNIEEFCNGQKLYDSFVADCLPFWNEALRRYSDLQVQMVLHVHSEKWEIEDTPCKTCEGKGVIIRNESRHTCDSCKGSGTKNKVSPFGIKTIKPSVKSGMNQATNIPIPPMGYIDKPIESTEFINKIKKENIKEGLAAINMEFLMDEPNENSGYKTALDRQESRAYFYNIGRHIVNNIFYVSYYLISKWRYGLQLSEEQIMANIPTINVPTKFDLIDDDILSQRLKSAKEAGVNPSLFSALESEMAKRQFGEDSDQAKILEAINQLDPLPMKTDDEKMTIKSNGGTTEFKYVLSCNLPAFIQRAMAENEGFLDYAYSDKMEILTTYTEEVIEDNKKDVVPEVTIEQVDAK